jgi:hypothetical protein
MKVELLSSHFRILIDRLPATIGRSAKADIRLCDPEISRVHCQIDQLNGVLLIRDTGSTNGTFVNGRRVVEAKLTPGDRVSVGQTPFVVLSRGDASCGLVSDSADKKHRGDGPPLPPEDCDLPCDHDSKDANHRDAATPMWSSDATLSPYVQANR